MPDHVCCNLHVEANVYLRGTRFFFFSFLHECYALMHVLICALRCI